MHQLPKANQNNGLILLCGLQNRLCKSGFTKAVLEAAQEDEAIVLVGLGELMHEDSVWPL